jgi:hypothetical protein
MSYQIHTSNITGPIYTVTSGTGAVGASGQTLISNGSGQSNWAWNTVSADPNLQGNSLQVKGDANFEGDVKIKGKSIADSLERIEAQLAILKPNEELEAKWENLRGLRKAYMELEAEIIEKQKVWDILKK